MVGTVPAIDVISTTSEKVFARTDIDFSGVRFVSIAPARNPVLPTRYYSHSSHRSGRNTESVTPLKTYGYRGVEIIVQDALNQPGHPRPVMAGLSWSA
ncbi:MAG: hypothetical protein ACC641_04145 [Acidiferrobacterales bacterium]